MLLKRRRALLLAFGAVGAAGVAGAAGAEPPPLAAPNVVPISARLVTSGQPTPAALGRLAELGFQAVIYLAPNSVPDAVLQEPELLARQGIELVHIPIPFGAPQAAHVQAALAALERLSDKKVLVHCQVNMRASSMVFLHRVLRGREDPEKAYEAVAKVWSPSGPWRQLLVAQLAEHGVAFAPY